MTGRTILHVLVATLAASATTSIVFSLITLAVHKMEDTAGGNDGFLGVAILISFVLVLLPALLVIGGLVAGGASQWWAYVAGGIAMALIANIFIGEFNTRLISFSTAAGIAGGLAAFLYLKYVAKLWEAGHA